MIWIWNSTEKGELNKKVFLKEVDKFVLSGTTLSGGQKQRTSLARVVYSKTQTVLLDDPFSALDNTVAKKVFNGAVKKLLLGTGRTVVMVTSSQGTLVIYNDRCLVQYIPITRN